MTTIDRTADLEMTKLCAESIGMEYSVGWKGGWTDNVYSRRVYTTEELAAGGIDWCQRYNPLENDAQAMALVKKFNLALYHNGLAWWATRAFPSFNLNGVHENLNRAIVECVAKMQAAVIEGSERTK